MAILTLCVAIWGTPKFTAWIDSISTIKIPVQGLDHVVFRVPPVVPVPTPEAAVFTFNWLSATGTGIFIAALITAFVMGLRPADIGKVFAHTIVSTRFTMITIAALRSLGYITRFCGLDATLGLAFSRTGAIYPLFGTLVGGWGRLRRGRILH